mmetsp:Transcript_4320/g.13342  ORF Transcript_4320/g.13342 Transcript_4320/m.13342 type:complete len:644 (-) Transcript_4320:155-2086(-)
MEERRRLARPRLELWVVLAADKVTVLAQLKDLHPLALNVLPDKLEARLVELRDVLRVHLVPVTVTLIDRRDASVQPRGEAFVGAQDAPARSEPHRAAHHRLGDLRHIHDHWMLCVLVKLGRMRVLPAKHCARELDHSDLESQADAKVGHTVLARVLCGKDLALDAAIAKAARNENAVRPSEQLPRGQVLGRVARLHLLLQLARLDPVYHELALARVRRVHQRLGDGEVGVAKRRVLANDRDLDGHRERVDERGERAPLGQDGRRVPLELKLVEKAVEDALLLEEERHAVNVGHVVHADALLLGHVAKVCELLLGLLVKRARRAADEKVRRDAERAERLHRVLRRLGLLLADGADDGHERHVEEGDVLPAHLPLKLPHSLDEGHRFNVAHRAAQLDDAHVGRAALAVLRRVRDALDPLLDRVGDVRHHLHCLSQKVALALTVEHGLVDLARRDVVVARQVEVHEALVVAQIEVGLATVVEHEHFAVLEWRHRARVHVDVWVDLDRGYAVPRRLDEHPDRRGGDALADARDDATRDENVLGRARPRRVRQVPLPWRQLHVAHRATLARDRNLVRRVAEPEHARAAGAPRVRMNDVRGDDGARLANHALELDLKLRVFQVLAHRLEELAQRLIQPKRVHARLLDEG